MSGSMTKRLRRWAAAAACAVSALGAGGAQAAVFVTNWDPLFGNPLFTLATGVVDLSWDGSGKVELADSCLVPSSVQTVGSLTCPFARFTAYGFSYSWTLPSPGGGGGGGIAPLGFNTLLFVSIDSGGNVDGVDMDVPLVVASNSFGSATTYDLKFDLTTLSTVKFNIVGTVGPDAGSSYFNGIDPIVTWTRISEPGSLVLLGLAGFGLLRRRRA